MASTSLTIDSPPLGEDDPDDSLPGYEKLTKRLNDFIIKGKFSIGSKLPSERALAEQFGVSRSSVREAIRTLAEKGLLESRHGDGTYVCNSDMTLFQPALLAAVDCEGKQFDYAIEFRKIYDPVIAFLAARRCTPQQLNKLKLITFEQQRKIFNDENEGDVDAEFHLALAEATQNPLFVKVMRQVNEYYAKGRTPELRSRDWKNWSVTMHLKIIDAIERRDQEACSEAMKIHLDAVSNRHPFKKLRDK